MNWTRGTETQADGGRGPADRIPPLNAELGWRRELHADLALSAFLRHAADQERLSNRDQRDPRIDPEGTAAWTTLNLHADWSPRSGLRLVGGIDNLLDRTYREHGSGIDAPGRNLKLSVEMTW